MRTASRDQAPCAAALAIHPGDGRRIVVYGGLDCQWKLAGLEQYSPRETHIAVSCLPKIRAIASVLQRSTPQKFRRAHLPYTPPLGYADNPAPMPGPA